jgi:excisionase family DNA binding protein
MRQWYLSVEEVARRLGGISRWTVYSWMQQGRLRKTKVGSRVMVSEENLQDFIDDCNAEDARKSNNRQPQ